MHTLYRRVIAKVVVIRFNKRGYTEHLVIRIYLLASSYRAHADIVFIGYYKVDCTSIIPKYI